MKRALFLLALALVPGCGVRAPLPAPREPIAATPREAMSPPPEAEEPPAPFSLRLARRELDNGARVVVAPRPAEGRVSVVLATRAGAALDPRAPRQLTESTVRAIFDATRMPNGEVVEDYVTAQGFEPVFAVRGSHLAISSTFRADALERYLTVLDRALRFPAYDAEAIAARARRRLERHATAVREPAGFFDEALPSLLYAPGSPLTEPHRRDIEALRSLDVPRIEARRRQLLDPAATALVVVGDVEPLEAIRIAGRVLSQWARGPATPALPDVAYAGDGGPRALGIVQPGRLRCWLQLVEQAPPIGHPDYPAFLVLEQLLGGMFSSRLNLAVREEHGVSYGVGARYASDATHGTLEVSVSVDPPYCASVAQALLDEVRRMRGDPPGDPPGSPGQLEDLELRIAKTRAREQLLGGLDHPEGLARAIAHRLSSDVEVGRIGTTLRRIDRMTSRELHEAAREWLRPERAPVGVIAGEAVVSSVERRVRPMQIFRAR